MLLRTVVSLSSSRFLFFCHLFKECLAFIVLHQHTPPGWDWRMAAQ